MMYDIRPSLQLSQLLKAMIEGQNSKRASTMNMFLFGCRAAKQEGALTHSEAPLLTALFFGYYN